MKRILAVLLLATAAAGLQGQEGRKQKPAPKAKPAAALEVPPGAEKMGEGVWRARDAQGRTWIYRRTPFGLVREQEGAAGRPAPPEKVYIRVREAGESAIVFERDTPFGRRTWSKSPQELDDEERLALEQWRRSATGAAATGEKKN